MAEEAKTQAKAKPESETPVTLRSTDGKTFVVERKIANMSETIRIMLESLGDVTEKDIVPVNLSTEVLTNVLSWSERHKNDYKPTTLQEDSDKHYDPHSFDREAPIEMSEDDRKFYEELGIVNLFKLLMAANFLDIKALIQSACKYLASLIKDKQAKDIVDLLKPVKEYNLSIESGTKAEVENSADKPENSQAEKEKIEGTEQK